MARKKFYRKEGRINVIGIVAAMVVSVAVLVFFMPRESTFSMQYDQGKPWRYGALIAGFDFPIMKTDKDIASEKDSMTRSFVPYYAINSRITDFQVERLGQILTDSFSIPNTVRESLLAQMRDIYNKGIISIEEYDILQNSCKGIRLIENNKASKVDLENIFSTAQAYKKLISDNEDASQILRAANLNEFLIPNLIYDSLKSETSRKDILTSITLASGIVMSGQKIIDKGDIVDKQTYNILLSYEKEINKRNESSLHDEWIMFGHVIYVVILLGLLIIYLYLYRRDYLEKLRSILMVFILVSVLPIMCYLMVSHNFFSVYVLPFTMVPIFISVFMDSRTAFISHVIMVLLCACSLRTPYEFIVVQTVAGGIAIATLRDLSSRSQLIKTAILTALGSAAIYFAIEIVQYGDVSKLDKSMYFHFAENGVLLLFAYPLMWCIEKIFGFTSNVTLVELSNTNNPLLRQLSEVAPGTFQHAIQVGNLAAEVANRIGAKSQEVRTGALYHDIGKMIDPAFFIENQSGVNPHDKLSPTDSARILVSHVTEGVKLAEKNGLPKMIIDFIATHHGMGKCKYFYNKFIEENPGVDVDTLTFTYPGPNPFTLEQAILMMADASEAATRSLTEYTEKSISEMVEKVIDTQMAEGYFRDCPITFHDIAIAKTVLTEKLKTAYHTRIKYPEM
ncbi:MAG: HDIG domain-containing protein [Prevotellaceae bacterium]|nr:HDIG domain-containing protein [Prevotellaceae bacterium]